MSLVKVIKSSSNEDQSFVEQAVERTTNIATLPTVAIEMMKLVDDPTTSVQDVLRVIENDPALGSRLLKVVNSSFYGMPQTIGSIDRAVVLLGLNAVKNIATAASLHKVFNPKDLGTNFDAAELWLHCVAVATAAREVASKIGLVFPEEAFLAGLIHDIGILVAMQACRPKFVQLLELLDEYPEMSFRDAEQKTIGVTHESFGAALCKSWKFPIHLIIAAGNHHAPMQLKDEYRALPAVVHVADILACRNNIGYSRSAENQNIDENLMEWLNLDIFDIELIEERLQSTIKESQELLCN